VKHAINQAMQVISHKETGGLLITREKVFKSLCLVDFSWHGWGRMCKKWNALNSPPVDITEKDDEIQRSHVKAKT
jgi:hypothetical protein